MSRGPRAQWSICRCPRGVVVVRRRWSRHRDRGSATVWVLSCCTVILALVAATLAVGAAVVARHRAWAVADLAALAAAQSLVEGAAQPCRPAARVAAAQGGRLVGCAVVGDVVEVIAEVSVARTGPLSALSPARARARAGPTAPSP